MWFLLTFFYLCSILACVVGIMLGDGREEMRFFVAGVLVSNFAYAASAATIWQMGAP